jgi:hypothetical protein
MSISVQDASATTNTNLLGGDDDVVANGLEANDPEPQAPLTNLNTNRVVDGGDDVEFPVDIYPVYDLDPTLGQALTNAESSAQGSNNPIIAGPVADVIGITADTENLVNRYEAGAATFIETDGPTTSTYINYGGSVAGHVLGGPAEQGINIGTSAYDLYYTTNSPAATNGDIASSTVNLIGSVGKAIPGDAGRYITGGAALYGTVNDYASNNTINKGNNVESTSDDFLEFSTGELVGNSSTIVGSLIGGKTGETIANAGAVASPVIDVATNGSFSGVSVGTAVGAGFAAADLMGIEVDPAVKEWATTAANIASGPVGWVAEGVHIITGLMNMGDSYAHSNIASGMNISGGSGVQGTPGSGTGDVDHVYHQKTGFYQTGNYSSQRIQYFTDGYQIASNKINSLTYELSAPGSEEQKTMTDGDGSDITPEDQNADSYTLRITGDYAQLNPGTGTPEDLPQDTMEISAEEYATLTEELGGTSGVVSGTESEKIATLQQYSGGINLRYENPESDPNLRFYNDVDGDGNQDLMAVSMPIEGMKVVGDNSVTVSYMDANGNLDEEVTANNHTDYDANIADLGQMQAQEPLLKMYAASHPDTWNTGTDTDAIYDQLAATNQLDSVNQLTTAWGEYSEASASGSPEAINSAEEKITALNNELGITFNPQAYAEANPDVAAAFGDDSFAITEHYLEFGNQEGRVIDAEGTVQEKWVNPALSDTDVVGPEISNTNLVAGQSLVSPNGDYKAMMQADGNLVVTNISEPETEVVWDTSTEGASHVSVQADGNLVAYNSANEADWSSGTGTEGANGTYTLSMGDDGALRVTDSASGAQTWSSTEGMASNEAAQAEFAAIAADSGVDEDEIDATHTQPDA